MLDNSSIEQLFDIVAAKRHADSVATGLPDIGVTDEEKEQVRSWADGGELKHLVNQPGYELFIGKITRIMDEAIGMLRDTDPANTAEVLGNHAILYASHKILARLLGEVARDIANSETVPYIVKEGAKVAKGVPPAGI